MVRKSFRMARFILVAEVLWMFGKVLGMVGYKARM